MPSLQELLASKQPDELQSLLDSIKGSNPATPTPGPTPLDTLKTAPDQGQANAISATQPTDPTNLAEAPVTTPPVMAPNQEVPPLPSKPMGPFSDVSKYMPSMDLGKNFDQPPAPEEKEEESDPSAIAGLFAKHLQDRSPSSAPASDGFTNNTVENLKKVQDQANDTKHQDQTFRNLNLFATSLAGGKAAALKANNEPFDDEDKMADEKVQQFKDLTAKEGDDANSKVSKQTSNFAAEMLDKAGFDPKLVQGMSYNEIEKNFPQITKMLDVKVATDARKDVAEQNALNRAAMLEGKKADKTTDAQNKALLQTVQLLESARGNPAAAQAEKDLYAADKAKSLATLYGNPNKLSPQMVQLLSTEVAKIASGGTPSMHELEGLNPQTLQSRFAGIWQKVANHPTAANAAEFVKQYEDYAGALTKDAQKVIKEKYGRVIESRKTPLGDDNYKSLQDQYINRFITPASDSTQSGPALQPGQEIKELNGKKYIVDHNTKQVIGEAP